MEQGCPGFGGREGVRRAQADGAGGESMERTVTMSGREQHRGGIEVESQRLLGRGSKEQSLWQWSGTATTGSDDNGQRPTSTQDEWVGRWTCQRELETGGLVMAMCGRCPRGLRPELKPSHNNLDASFPFSNLSQSSLQLPSNMAAHTA
jgi:hypothetical protein